MNNKASLLHNASRRDWRNWQWQFRNRITKLEDIASFYGRKATAWENLKKAAAIYPLAITPYYFSLINEDNENDPIRSQCFPDEREITFAGGSADPLLEDSYMPAPKLVRRYPDRALAIVTETCATYCRHCNRKRYWSVPASGKLQKRIQRMINYVAATPQIREVIISGGDPLTLGDPVLESLLKSFRAIPHVEILRLGSRVPVTMPMRITKDLCRMLKRCRPLWFNTQFNHPAEITSESARACNMLLEAGIPVSNQSVLLKGVNDSASVIRDLLYSLQKISVRPYYLFHCDPVKGCAHFRTGIAKGLTIMKKIRRQSGLSLPQYVLDVPGEEGKLPLTAISRTAQNDLKKFQYFFDKCGQID
ncbi:MAG TPA: KamA family radical SAM protein [Smithellaceae bacterium]|nr:KamA family radical SAM protein [Smithellaceae bacterium]